VGPVTLPYSTSAVKRSKEIVIVLSGLKKVRTKSPNFAAPAASAEGDLVSVNLMLLITTVRFSLSASVRAWIDTTPGVDFPPCGSRRDCHPGIQSAVIQPPVHLRLIVHDTRATLVHLTRPAEIFREHETQDSKKKEQVGSYLSHSPFFP
jgi:hypothetical protein